MDISAISSNTNATAQSVLVARKALQAQQLEGMAAVKLITDSHTSATVTNAGKDGSLIDIYA